MREGIRIYEMGLEEGCRGVSFPEPCSIDTWEKTMALLTDCACYARIMIPISHSYINITSTLISVNSFPNSKHRKRIVPVLVSVRGNIAKCVSGDFNTLPELRK